LPPWSAAFPLPARSEKSAQKESTHSQVMEIVTQFLSQVNNFFPKNPGFFPGFLPDLTAVSVAKGTESVYDGD
jgi:hypothetical protein